MSVQSRKGSLIEACLNTMVGFLFAFVIQLTLNHFYGVEMSNTTAAHFVFWFTMASVVRNYLIRRLFNRDYLRMFRVSWKYRKIDPTICCCGSPIGLGGSICGHGGCKSFRRYVIEQELKSGN